MNLHAIRAASVSTLFSGAPDFSQEQAETLAPAIAENALDTLATKADLSELKVDLVRWIVTAIAFNFVATAGFIITALKLFK